jgi:hypothetical protein
VAASDRRVSVIEEAVRSGKARAINLFLASTEQPYIAFVGGDILLGPGSLRSIVGHLRDPSIGMTGCRVVPTNGQRGVANRLTCLLWELHHKVALDQPKLGEVVALRRLFETIDPGSPVDEISMEALVSSCGYRLRYVPEAIVFNQGPRNLRDYLELRARNHHGHVAVCAETGYAASTFRLGNAARASLRLASDHPSQIPLLCLAVAVEGVSRGLGRVRHWRMPADTVWRPISSAKLPFPTHEAVTLIESATIELGPSELAGEHT